jgi:hypothetical protein
MTWNYSFVQRLLPYVALYAHTPMVVARRVPFAFALLCGLLLAAVVVALRAKRQIRLLELQNHTTTQALESARLSIRERDSMLAQLSARVDTVRVPIVRYAVVRDSLRVSTVAARESVEPIDVASRRCTEPRVETARAIADDSAKTDSRTSPSVRQAGWPLRPQPRTLGANMTYLSLLSAADFSNAWLHIDRDPGGYVDTWNTQDKLAHAAMGAVLSMSAIDAGVHAPWAVAFTCAGAAGFELSQGYVSRKDIIAGCAGAAVGAGVHWGVSKLVERKR